MNCQSCGMPMATDADHGGARPDNVYCQNCTDATGNLKSREEVREGMIAFYMQSMNKGREEAEKEVDTHMAQMPAWQGTTPVTVAQPETVPPMPAPEPPVPTPPTMAAETVVPDLTAPSVEVPTTAPIDPAPEVPVIPVTTVTPPTEGSVPEAPVDTGTVPTPPTAATDTQTEEENIS